MAEEKPVKKKEERFEQFLRCGTVRILKSGIVFDNTLWKNISLTFISNSEDDYNFGHRMYSNEERCFTCTMKATLPDKSAAELYDLLRHLYHDCDTEQCPYCGVEYDKSLDKEPDCESTIS